MFVGVATDQEHSRNAANSVIEKWAILDDCDLTAMILK